MNLLMTVVGIVVVSYLVGTINPAYIISKLKNFDIREAGSGNAGGSNALISMGKFIGISCMVFDILKAYVVVKLSMTLFRDIDFAGATATTAVILGHVFPFYMHFRGGKGLACLGGSLLAYSIPVAMCFLVVELILVFLVNYICVVPISGSIAFPIVYFVRESGFGNPYAPVGSLILLIATFTMLYKHRENLRRIAKGTEAHFSMLWNREKELERLIKNMTDEEYDNIQIKKKV